MPWMATGGLMLRYASLTLCFPRCAVLCRCCDLDGDGRLTPDELLYFYEEQLHRMECLSQVGGRS